VSKLCTKFEQNWIIHGWVIDDLAPFRRAILKVENKWQGVLRGAWTQLHKTWRGQMVIMATQECVLEFRYLAAISNAGGSRLTDVENDATFRTFCPHGEN